MDAVINQFNIGQIYMPKVTTTTKTFQDVMTAIQNKKLAITTPVPGSNFSLGQDTCTILAQ
jgi:competence protein ComEC